MDRRACPQIDMHTGSRFRVRRAVPEPCKRTAMWHEPTRQAAPLPLLRAAFLWAISVAPSQRGRPSQSILTGAAILVTECGCAWDRASPLPFGAAPGSNHGQRRQRFSAVLLYGIIRHGDCPRGREPAHRAATLLSDAPRAVTFSLWRKAGCLQ